MSKAAVKLLYCVILLLSFPINVSAECYAEDRKMDEVTEFNLQNYKIEIGSTPMGVSAECNDNVDFFRVHDDQQNLVFDKPWAGYDDKYDYNPTLVKKYQHEILKKPYLKDLVEKLKSIEGRDWEYFIVLQWAGSCGGCLQLHQVSFDSGFKYHGRIFLQPATPAVGGVSSIRKKDVNGNLIYNYELK